MRAFLVDISKISEASGGEKINKGRLLKGVGKQVGPSKEDLLNKVIQ